ncbi:MAG: AMP-binding protein [Nitrospirae bacterium]|nr:AMP-binding protein [Nitrospirota bacterium]
MNPLTSIPQRLVSSPCGGFSIPEEALSGPELESLQSALLREAVAFARRRSPFYRAHFSRFVDPDSPAWGLPEFRALPTTGKDDLVRLNRDFLAVDSSRVADIVATSGTTGRPIRFFLTARDIERLAENERQSFLCAGVRPGETYHLAVSLDNMFVAGLAYFSGLVRIGAAAVRQGPGNPLRHVHLLGDIRPAGIVCVPSFMLELARVSEREGIDPSSLGLQRGIFVGETIRNGDFSPNALGRRIAADWGIRLHSSYGATEICTSLTECEHGRGGHLHPTLMYAEILDERGQPLPRGEAGELVVTTFGVEAMPLVRYRTGDVSFIETGPCPCGRTTPRLGPILGRRTHMIELKGAQIYPGQVEDCIREVPEVVNYQIEAYTGDDYADRLRVFVGAAPGSDGIVDLLREKVRAQARVTPEFVALSPDAVRERLFAGGSRKARRFVDSRRPAS